MKDLRYNISLDIIIPFIISGTAALSIIVSYRLTGYYLGKGMDPVWPVAFWGIIMVLFTFVFSFIIARMFIDPMNRFIKKTERLGVLKKTDNKSSAVKQDEISRFSSVFDQVTELLGNVEAKELFPDITGQSRVMRGVFNKIVKVAPTDSSVLILGETGTGKELVAKSIYEHSLRSDKPFVAINCAAIPENLIESELFGHEKGAFTGAGSKKIGRFEFADGGVIFMDEIGDMPLATQAKVLRAIEESQIQRVGGVKTIKINVRFIAATNKNLALMVDQGKFRQDLFFRLNVFSVHLPALRERREDIPALVSRFIKDQSAGNTTKDVSPESMHLLTAYNWPGNVRELKNAMEAAYIMANNIIEPRHFPAVINIPGAWSGNENHKKNLPENLSENMEENLDQRLKKLEKGMIIDALTRTGGVQINAARYLGIKERSLWHRIKKLEIDAASFKADKAKKVVIPPG